MALRAARALVRPSGWSVCTRPQRAQRLRLSAAPSCAAGFGTLGVPSRSFLSTPRLRLAEADTESGQDLAESSDSLDQAASPGLFFMHPVPWRKMTAREFMQLDNPTREGGPADMDRDYLYQSDVDESALFSLSHDPKMTTEEQRELLADSGQVKEKAVQQAPPRFQKIDEQGRAFGRGTRKTAVARVWITPTEPGTGGEVIINRRPLAEYFPQIYDRFKVTQPFEATETLLSFNVRVVVQGGGPTGNGLPSLPVRLTFAPCTV